MRGNGRSATRLWWNEERKPTAALWRPLAVVPCLIFPWLFASSIRADDPLPETVFCLTETPERIKTPPGSGMGKKEYPFDEEGDYRKDWADPRSRSSEKRSTTVRSPIPEDSPDHSLVQARKKIEEEKAARKLAEEKRRESSLFQKASVKLDLANSVKPAFQGREIPASHFTSKKSDTMESILTRIPLGKPQPRTVRPVGTTSTSTRAAPDDQANSILHKVGKGDTLWSLSQRYKTTVPEIQKANGLTSSLIRIGQILRIK